jgi:MFS family permease
MYQDNVNHGYGGGYGSHDPRQVHQQDGWNDPRAGQPATQGAYKETVTEVDLGQTQDNAQQPRVLTSGNYIPPQDLLMEIWTNKQLRVPKAFYFFFFAAFGSLFPLMAVYFKQLGMNSVQTGILIGIRPFIEIFSAPFWGSLADRFKKGKIMIMASIFCWIVFTCSLAYIRPPATACVIFNATHYVMYTPYSDQTDDWYEEAVVEKGRKKLPGQKIKDYKTTIPTSRRDLTTTTTQSTFEPYAKENNKDRRKNKRSYSEDGVSENLKFADSAVETEDGYDRDFIEDPEQTNKNNWMMDDLVVSDDSPDSSSLEYYESKTRLKREDKKKTSIFDSIDPLFRFKPPPGHIIGKSPTNIDYTLNYNKDKHASYVSPAFSTIVYKWDDVREVFFLLLLLVLLGEFFSAPAVTLADAATLNYLGEHTDLYGRQRMFGSVGWAISMLLVGIALDKSLDFPNHPCGPHERERNYKTCFTYFAILMAVALAIASRFDFQYDEIPFESHEDIQLNPFDPKKPEQKQQQATPQPRSIFNQAPPINPPPDIFSDSKKFEFIDKWKSAVFAQRQRKLPDWMTVIRSCSNLRYGSFLFVVWFMGLGIGLVFAFLFWHLQDLGGTPTLFGVASVINHISEIIAYFYSLQLIKELGHTRVLCLGLAGNVGRFLYIAWVTNPWLVLPFELIQGVTHATVWAACCSYITQAISDSNLKQSTQGILQILHHGLGRGCGAIIGGYFINIFGTRVTFACYGLLSALVLAFYVRVNYKRTEDGSLEWQEDTEGHVVVMDEGVGLAPHGVPSAPIAKHEASSHDPRQNIPPPSQQYQQQAHPSNVYDPLSEVNAQWGGAGGTWGASSSSTRPTSSKGVSFSPAVGIQVNPLDEITAGHETNSPKGLY